MDNNKERWKQVKEVGRAGAMGRKGVGWGGGERQKTVLEQQFF